MHLVFFIIAIFAYIYAPFEYNHSYCAVLTLLFLLQSLLVLKKDIYVKNYINFNLFFLVSFFLVTYSFPTFILGTELDTIDKYISAIVDYKYITRAMSLSHLAISSYLMAFSLIKSKGEVREKRFQDYKPIKWKLLKVLYTISFTSVSLLYFKHLLQGAGIAVVESPFLYDIYRVIFTLYLVLWTLKETPCDSSILVYFRNNKFCLITSSVFLLLCLLIGDRGPILNIGIVIVAVYVLFVRKMKLVTLMSVAFTALVLMFSLRVTRVGSSSLVEGGLSSFIEKSKSSMNEMAGLLVLFSDLTGTSSEMTVGYEIVQKEGIKYPMSIFVVLVSPVPKAPSIVSNLLYSKMPAEITSGRIIQKYVSSVFEWHNGTHCVMDIYIHWGVIGVIIIFFLFGLCMSFINKKKDFSLQYTLIYILLLSIAFYIPRSSIFDIMRPIFYIVVFMMLVRGKKRPIIMNE